MLLWGCSLQSIHHRLIMYFQLSIYQGHFVRALVRIKQQRISLVCLKGRNNTNSLLLTAIFRLGRYARFELPASVQTLGKQFSTGSENDIRLHHRYNGNVKVASKCEDCFLRLNLLQFIIILHKKVEMMTF